MIINVHGGHNKIVQGAVRYLNEVDEDRKVKNALMRILKQQGHTVYDCTDDMGKTQNDNLRNIVQKCNAHKVDLNISIHLNAGGGEGVEVLCYDSKMDTTSQKVCNAIANGLGIKNRGVKHRTDLYVLNSTKSPAILIECCFVDSQNDKARWNVEKCAQAIANSLMPGHPTSPQPVGKPFVVKIAHVAKMII